MLKYVRNAVWEYYEPSRAMNTASSKKPGNETVGALDAGRRPRPSIPPEDPDFILSPTTCALFISLKYHLLHPSYLLHRINHLKSSQFSLKICLAVVDIVRCDACSIVWTQSAFVDTDRVVLCDITGGLKQGHLPNHQVVHP